MVLPPTYTIDVIDSIVRPRGGKYHKQVVTRVVKHIRATIMKLYQTSKSYKRSKVNYHKFCFSFCSIFVSSFGSTNSAAGLKQQNAI